MNNPEQLGVAPPSPVNANPPTSDAPMMPLRVLIVEDSEDDASLVEGELEAAGFSVLSRRVDRPDELRGALDEAAWDLVVSDYATPRLDALDALDIVHRSGQPDLPFLIVSDRIGEESAVAALKAGASNYLVKANLAQLLPVVDRELRSARIRREREEAFAALEQAVSARDEFLSIASHELKTPLTCLRLQAQGLARAAQRERGAALDNAQVLQRIASIERNAERLTSLIERLLDITRVATGRLRLSRGNVDLVRVARHVASEMADTFRDAGCEVAIAAPAHLVGDWDGDRLEMVVRNLLSNAAKYGARRPIRVELEDAGDAARLRVIDRGIGISAEDQRRIFGRFERAVPERHYGGFGVGLWLAEQLVEAHGGRIEVESDPGRGSTFSVTLPKQAGAA